MTHTRTESNEEARETALTAPVALGDQDRPAKALRARSGRARGRSSGEVYVGLGDEVNVVRPGSHRIRRLRRRQPPGSAAALPDADALAYTLLLDAGGGDSAEAAHLARRFRGLVLRPHLARGLWHLPAARVTAWLEKQRLRYVGSTC